MSMPPPRFFCGHCGADFDTKDALDGHVENNHMFRFGHCGALFPSEAAQTQHVRSHEPL
jgi:hypothetical protein